MPTALWIFPIMFASCFIASIGSLLLKKGAASFTLRPAALLRNHALMGGVFLFGLGFGVYTVLLKFEQLSVLYALGATTYIWTALLARRYLGEDINGWKAAGIAAIVIGVSLVSLGG